MQMDNGRPPSAARITLARLATAARIALALVSLCGLATIAVWIAYPGLVHALDERLKASYVGAQEEQLQRITEGLDDPAVGGDLRALQRLLDDLREVRKRDRLAPIKRAALHLLGQQHQAAGNTAGALAAYADMIELDDKDIEARIERASLLYEIPERRSQGEELITALYRRIPSAPIVAQRFLEVAADRRDLGAATRAAYDIYATSRSRLQLEGWRLFWDTGEGFSAASVLHARPQGMIENRLTLAARIAAELETLEAFRIDPPAGVCIVLSAISVEFRGAGQELTASSRNVTFRVARELRPGTLLIKPKTPTGSNFFLFRLPEALALEHGIEVTIQASVMPWIPQQLEELATEAGLADATRQRLQDPTRPGLGEFFERLAVPPSTGPGDGILSR